MKHIATLEFLVKGYIWYPERIDFSEAKEDDGAAPKSFDFQFKEPWLVSGNDSEMLEERIGNLVHGEGKGRLIHDLSLKVGNFIHETNVFINEVGEVKRLLSEEFYQVRITSVCFVGIRAEDSPQAKFEFPGDDDAVRPTLLVVAGTDTKPHNTKPPKNIA